MNIYEKMKWNMLEDALEEWLSRPRKPGPAFAFEVITHDLATGNLEMTVVNREGKTVATVKYVLAGVSPPDFDLNLVLADFADQQ